MVATPACRLKLFRKIKSFKTLDLSASNEFTCNFENGPLGLQFGDGVRKDGEKFVEVLNILPGGQAAKYTELRDGDVIVRVGQRHVRGMDFDNVVSIIKRETRPLEITFIHGKKALKSNEKEISVTFDKNEALGITFGDAVDAHGNTSVEVVSLFKW